METAINSLTEHASIIILILAAFATWSSKRLIGKMVSDFEELARIVNENEKENRKIHADIYTKQNKTAEELHELLGEHKVRNHP